MEDQNDKTKIFLETIRKELVSIIEDGSENCESNSNKEDDAEVALSQHQVDRNEIRSFSICDRRKDTTPDIPLKSTGLNTTNISTIDGDIQQLQNNLDESYKLFHSIGERFDSINFSCLKNRIKDLHLSECSTDPTMTIVNDLKHTFDKEYMENRLTDLTKEISSKFRNHPGEFGDIPEISEFFRACTRLEQGLEKLRKQRDDCINLQKRIKRVAEASYDRVNDIQQKIMMGKAQENN